jgi:uncharacterized protein YbcI
MGEAKRYLASYAEEIVGRGSRATIYFDGQSLEVISISRHEAAAELLVCRDAAGKVAMIDTRRISAVVSGQPQANVH